VNIKEKSNVIYDLIMTNPLPTPYECVGSLANHCKILFWVVHLSTLRSPGPLIPSAFHFARKCFVLNILKFHLYFYWPWHGYFYTFFCCENVRILSNFTNSVLENGVNTNCNKLAMQLISFYRQEPLLTSTKSIPKYKHFMYKCNWGVYVYL
jgi:hypothetical protein